MVAGVDGENGVTEWSENGWDGTKSKRGFLTRAEDCTPYMLNIFSSNARSSRDRFLQNTMMC